MIWFFLAGVIAGAVGMIKYSTWWVRKHVIPVRIEKEDPYEQGRDEETHIPGD